MTVLGFTSISNTDIQSAVQKNTQFLLLARNSSTTEINAQLGDINNNTPAESDPIIQEVLDAGLNNEYIVAETGDDYNAWRLRGPGTAFEKSVKMTMTCKGECTLAGFSIGVNQAPFASMVTELQVSAQLGDTAAKSTQTLGYRYLVPASN